MVESTIDKIKDITVLPMTDLEQFVKDNAIDIGVLTIPKSAAKEVADRLVACGVHAIWNFAHVDLDVPDYVLVENVHLSVRGRAFRMLSVSALPTRSSPNRPL